MTHASGQFNELAAVANIMFLYLSSYSIHRHYIIKEAFVNLLLYTNSQCVYIIEAVILKINHPNHLELLLEPIHKFLELIEVFRPICRTVVTTKYCSNVIWILLSSKLMDDVKIESLIIHCIYTLSYLLESWMLFITDFLLFSKLISLCIIQHWIIMLTQFFQLANFCLAFTKPTLKVWNVLFHEYIYS